jgi:ribose 5-phosphate isomerase B
MNLMCLGGQVIGYALAWEVLQQFLHAQFKEDQRFIRRLEKIKELEISESTDSI